MKLQIASGLLALAFATALAAEDLSNSSIGTRVLKSTNPYEALGIGTNASEADIKAAHRRVIMAYHQRANTGDKEALEIVSLANSARDAVNGKGRTNWSNPNTNSSTGKTASGSGSATKDSKWDSFSRSMDAAKTPEQRSALQQGTLKNISSAREFTDVVRGGIYSSRPGIERERSEFIVKNIDLFMRLKPDISDLNTLGNLAWTKEGQQAVYRAALAAAKTPDDILRMLKPELRGFAGGGPDWVKNLSAAARAELHHFLELNPTQAQLDTLGATLRVSFPKGEGASILAAAMRGGKPGFGEGLNLGAVQGLLRKTFGKFFALDPSLVTSAAATLVDASEADAFATQSCPKSLTSTGSYVLTRDFTQLLALSDESVRTAIIGDCRSKSPKAAQALGEALRKLADDTRRNILKNGRTSCAKNDDGSYGIRTILGDGMETNLRYDKPDEFSSVEVTSQKANDSHYLKFNNEASTNQAIEYSAFDYKQPVTRDKAYKIRESESSFYVRRVCLTTVCDRQTFLSHTLTSDENFFYFDPSKPQGDETNPFGEMNTKFIQRATSELTSELTLMRTGDVASRSYASICKALGGTPPSFVVDKKTAELQDGSPESKGTK